MRRRVCSPAIRISSYTENIPAMSMGKAKMAFELCSYTGLSDRLSRREAALELMGSLDFVRWV